MEIKFQTKEESNKAQLNAFLALSPSERVQSFFSLMIQLKDFPTKKNKKDNFIISKND